VETLFSHSFSKFKSCYHKCIKKLFGFSRSDSVCGILMQLSLPSFDTQQPCFISESLFFVRKLYNCASLQFFLIFHGLLSFYFSMEFFSLNCV